MPNMQWVQCFVLQLLLLSLSSYDFEIDETMCQEQLLIVWRGIFSFLTKFYWVKNRGALLGQRHKRFFSFVRRALTLDTFDRCVFRKLCSLVVLQHWLSGLRILFPATWCYPQCTFYEQGLTFDCDCFSTEDITLRQTRRNTTSTG